MAEKKMGAGIVGFLRGETGDIWEEYEKLAKIGYTYIESGGRAMSQGDVKENLRRLEGLGLKPFGTSTNEQQLKNDIDAVIEKVHLLGVDRVTSYYSPLTNYDSAMRSAEIYDKAGAKLHAEGIMLMYHNHEHEFLQVHRGQRAFDILLDNTYPDNLSFELDVAWAAFGQQDPVQLARRLFRRLGGMHLKDLHDMSTRHSFTSIGSGVVDITGCLKVAHDVFVNSGSIPCVIVEQDSLRNLDTFETLTHSYLTLKESGLVI